jgi:hypothetical protein
MASSMVVVVVVMVMVVVVVVAVVVVVVVVVVLPPCRLCALLWRRFRPLLLLHRTWRALGLQAPWLTKL